MKHALQMLYDEHDVIVSAIRLARQAGGLIPGNEPAYAALIGKLVAFFRQYADRYHHHKEEVILFPEMGKKNELLEEGVLKEMLENHDDFRGQIRDIVAALEAGDYRLAQRRLEAYTEALLDHIAVENDEVFQMADALFSVEEIDRLNFRFQDCDREISGEGVEEKASLARELKELEAEFLRITT